MVIQGCAVDRAHLSAPRVSIQEIQDMGLG